MLRLVLPKGSLERATLQLFEDADLAVVRSSEVDYRAAIDDPRVIDVTILRPQEIPRYVESGLFDLGITGRDWIEETAADVVTIKQLHYSKATARPFRIVVAVAGDSAYESVKDLPAGVRVQTEYPELTKRFFRDHGVEADISLSYGATEAKIPEIADAVVDGTESGRALRAAGLKVLDTVIVSYTELIANPASYDDLDKRKAMEQLETLLTRRARSARPGAREAQRRREQPQVGDRPLARAEVADGVEAVRRRRLRGRDRRRQARHQHAHPRAQGRRRDGPARDPDLQDRAVAQSMRGTVTAFDEHRGIGELAADDGARTRFHCTAIADGTRTIAVGTAVEFVVVPGHLGQWEAAAIEPATASRSTRASSRARTSGHSDARIANVAVSRGVPSTP